MLSHTYCYDSILILSHPFHSVLIITLLHFNLILKGISFLIFLLATVSLLWYLQLPLIGLAISGKVSHFSYMSDITSCYSVSGSADPEEHNSWEHWTAVTADSCHDCGWDFGQDFYYSCHLCGGSRGRLSWSHVHHHHAALPMHHCHPDLYLSRQQAGKEKPIVNITKYNVMQ